LFRKTVLAILPLCLAASLTACSGSSTPAAQPTTPPASAAAAQPTTVPAKPTVAPAKPTEAPKPTAKPAETTKKLGEVTEESGYSIVATSIVDPAKASSFSKPEAGKRLVAVEVTLANVSGKEFTSNPVYATLVDTDGLTYKSALGEYDGGQIAMNKLAAGEKVKGFIAFKIDEKATPKSIKFDFSGFSGPVLAAGLTK
jgi:hypothetical protein